MSKSTTRTFDFKRTPAAAAAALAVLIMSQAQAQTQPQAPAAEAHLDTVIVTANKRVEKLESVPMAISVVDEATIQRTNLREVEDLVAMTPALSVTAGSTSANNTINMRGIGTATVTIGIEADVAVIIDDIPAAQQFQAFKDLADVARIEVLKGPQSTLFGKSAVAGAVNIITKPVSGPMSGRSTAMMTSDGEWRYGISYGGEINEKFGVRVSANTTRYEGNLTNLTTNKMLNGSGGKTFLAKLAWHPTNDLDITFSPGYNYQTNTKGANAINSLTVTSPTGQVQVGQGGANPVNPLYLIPAGAATPANASALNAIPASKSLDGITPGPNNTFVRRDFPTGMNSSDRTAGLKIAYSLPSGATLMSITSFDRYLSDDFRDQDLGDIPTIALPGQTNYSIGNSQGGTYDIKTKTQELRLVSSDGGTFRYVGGLWYAKNTTARFFTRGDCRAPVTCSGSSVTSPVVYNTDVYNINKAVFGQATWEFLPTYTLLAGARLNQETSGYHFGRNYFTTMTPATFVAGKPGVDYFESIDNKERKVTGKVSLSKQINADWMVYGTVATGYKGLAYGLLSTLTPVSAAPVQSETSRTKEIGIKANLFHNRMTLNVAAFDTNFYNYQSSSTYTNPGDSTILTQISSVPRVGTRGVEIDTSALVTRNFVVNAALAYTDATVREWTGGSCYNDSKNVAAPGSKLAANGSLPGKNSNCFPITTGSTTGVQNLAGAPMQSAPKKRAVLSAQYDLRMADQSFDAFFTGAYKYQSEMITVISQDPSFYVPKFSVTDFGVGIRDKKDRYKLSFLINNFFDKHYATTGFAGAPSYRGATNGPASASVATWIPARDAFKFYSARLDVRF